MSTIEDAVVMQEQVSEKTPMLKLEADELAKLHTVLNKRNSITREIVDRTHMQREIERLDKHINTVLDECDTEQIAVLKELEEKYGKIQINPETGEYSQVN